jgi:branched-chain amino acid transport system substrate-binding protein
MFRARGVIVLTAATLIAFACGGNTGTGTSKGTFKIGSDLPVCTSGGLTTQNGIQFAIQQKANVQGYTIQFQGFDDCRQGKYSQDAGVENVQKMLGDNKFLGMIGPFNSAVAEAEIPIANTQHFTMISPSNTRECLTADFSYCKIHPADLRKGGPNNYWRVVTRDDYQGPAVADYAYKTLGLKNFGVLDDSTVFGTGIATNFEKRFKELGGTTKRSTYKVDQTSDFRTILLGFKNAGAQGIYAGGTDDQNLCVPKAQMKTIGWDVPFMGGDGIETTDCIDQASGNEANLYATSAGADATRIDGARATIDAFRKAFTGPNDLGGYTMQGYDATNVLLLAIDKAITANNGNLPSREQVRAQMAQIKGFKGVIGTYDFDANGDTSLKIVSIYLVTTNLSDAQVKDSTGVCGSKTAKNACFVWKAQVDYGAAK